MAIRSDVMEAIVQRDEEKALRLFDSLEPAKKTPKKLDEIPDAHTAFTDHGKSYLCAAAYYGMPRLVEKLLAQGANLTQRSRYNLDHRLPIDFGVLGGNVQVVETLHRAGAILTTKLLDDALLTSNLPMLQYLLAHGAPLCNGHIAQTHVRVAHCARVLDDEFLQNQISSDLKPSTDYFRDVDAVCYRIKSTDNLKLATSDYSLPNPSLVELASAMFVKEVSKPINLFHAAIAERHLSLLWFYVHIANVPTNQLILIRLFSLAIEHQDKSLLLAVVLKLDAIDPNILAPLSETYPQTFIPYEQLSFFSREYQCLFQLSLRLTQLCNDITERLSNFDEGMGDAMPTYRLNLLDAQKAIQATLDNFPQDLQTLKSKIALVLAAVSLSTATSYFSSDVVPARYQGSIESIVADLKNSEARVDALIEQTNPSYSFWNIVPRFTRFWSSL